MKSQSIKKEITSLLDGDVSVTVVHLEYVNGIGNDHLAGRTNLKSRRANSTCRASLQNADVVKYHVAHKNSGVIAAGVGPDHEHTLLTGIPTVRSDYLVGTVLESAPVIFISVCRIDSRKHDGCVSGQNSTSSTDIELSAGNYGTARRHHITHSAG